MRMKRTVRCFCRQVTSGGVVEDGGREHSPEAVSKVWAGKWDVEREVHH